MHEISTHEPSSLKTKTRNLAINQAMYGNISESQFLNHPTTPRTNINPRFNLNINRPNTKGNPSNY